MFNENNSQQANNGFQNIFLHQKIKNNFLIIFKIKNIFYQAAKNAPV